MFYGEYQHNIDTKGRLIIPSRFREVIAERKLGKLMMCPGLDSCLFLFGEEEWKDYEKYLTSLPLGRRSARLFVRSLIALACECELDKQGRIMVPAKLRKHAKLEGETIVTGVVNRIEVWNKDLWDELMREAGESFEDTAEELWSSQADRETR